MKCYHQNHGPELDQASESNSFQEKNRKGPEEHGDASNKIQTVGNSARQTTCLFNKQISSKELKKGVS